MADAAADLHSILSSSQTLAMAKRAKSWHERVSGQGNGLPLTRSFEVETEPVPSAATSSEGTPGPAAVTVTKDVSAYDQVCFQFLYQWLQPVFATCHQCSRSDAISLPEHCALANIWLLAGSTIFCDFYIQVVLVLTACS